jgi:hypothetical protein
MMDEDAFIDTWGWLALGHRKNVRQIITEDEHFHHVGMAFQKVPQELKG